MTQNHNASHRSLRSSFGVSLLGSVALFAACAEDPPGLFDPVMGTGGSTGGSGGSSVGDAGDDSGGTMSSGGTTGGKGAGGSGGSGGSKSTGGSSSGGHAGSESPATGGSSTASGGSGNATGEEGGMAGEDGAGGESDAGGSSGSGGSGMGGSAGDGAGGSSGMGGNGQGGSATVACVYQSPPVLPQGGSGGSAGDSGAGTGGTAGTNGAPVYDINVRVSPTVGKYLADRNGMTLYFRSSDLPGDCQSGNPPISRCTQANAACSTTWPPFNAGPRTLDPQLDASAFGTIQRDDGTYETTYFGWPLYTYVSDLAAGQVVGQGKGKVWHVAEIKLPNVVIMQEGTVKYLADGTGHTLYASSADVLGTDTSDPSSNCDSTCQATYEPFRAPRLYVVQSLEQDDFTLFVNPGGGPLQVAYKGAPLYRARTDVQGGDQTGVSGTFALVLP